MKITNPPDGSITFNDLQTELIDTSEFQRLNHIKQLGLVYVSFPCATNTRLVHCLGVCHLSGKIADTLKLSKKDKELIQVAALLHDIGHAPFSHAVESVLDQTHEEITAQIILGKEVLDIPNAGNIPIILRKYKIDAKDVAELIMGTYKKKPVLQNIISGPIDADKLDYLRRDSHFTGTVMGSIDIDRAIDVLRIKNNELCILEKGITSIVRIMFARQDMYREVYAHHSAIVAEKMLTKAVEISKDLLKNVRSMTDGELLAELKNTHPKSKEIVDKLMIRNLYKACFEIKSRGSKQEEINIVDKLRELGTTIIEKELAKKTNLENGDLIVNFSLKVKQRWKEIVGLKVLREDNTITDLGELSPISLHAINELKSNALFSVFCAKINAVKVKKAVNEFIKDINNNKAISEYIQKS